ncbi:MAG: DUF1761 domain-containing protein [Bacteroidales bacterium]|jgi:hypothetical protein|nr:DUF1761 domain-containing protein [Bacteroidales bacterium]MDD4829712.1 DUF1761 domain-containing protein [Bacteroidales bacterium]
METICSDYCPFEQISWLWYCGGVVVSFLAGALWYGFLFPKTWMKAVRYECACGADVVNGEKCTCKSRGVFLTMLFQFISTAFVVFMYFVLTPISIWLSVIVVVAVCAWMKSNLKFQISNWKRYITLALIDVGYFFIVSVIAVLFSLI